MHSNRSARLLGKSDEFRTSALVLGGALATCLLIAMSQALAQAPAPAGQAAKPADSALLTAEKAFLTLDIEQRRAIQRDLMWVAKFEATASGDFGPLTFAALKRFETEAKLPVDGILNSAERERLGKQAEALRLAAKFTVQTDKISGMKIGIPGAVFVKSAPNTSGGTRWQDKDEKITLDLSVFKPEDTLQGLFERGTDPKVQGRKITYKLLRSDFFVISGETASGKFFRRLQADPVAGIRGFSIGYDKAVAPSFDRFVIAMAGTFDAFPKPESAKPEPKAGSVPVATVPAQRRATGLVVAPETILASVPGLKGCSDLVVMEAEGARIPAKLLKRLDGEQFVLLSAKAGRPIALRVAAAANGAATLVQRDSQGELLASAAMLEGEKAATSLQDGGAGALLLDRSGALVGVISAIPVTKFRVAGVVPALSYVFQPAAEVLKSAGSSALAASGDMALKSSAEVAETARGSVVSLLCASD